MTVNVGELDIYSATSGFIRFIRKTIDNCLIKFTLNSIFDKIII